MKDYTLIIGAFPNTRYSAGWLAGNVIAHKISCEQQGKVFWFCPLMWRGVAQNDKVAFSELIRKISDRQKAVGKADNGLRLNKKGYFYDGSDLAVSWCFDEEAIFLHNTFTTHIDDALKSYRPYVGFREIYLQDKDRKDGLKCAWFLISNIERLDTFYPRCNDYKVPPFKVYTGNRLKTLRTRDFRHGGAVFAADYPQEVNPTNVRAIELIDRYLKQMFLSKGSDENLKERAIQLACAYSLMEKRKWTLQLERKLKCGRPDILFTENGDTLVVVEIKRDGKDNPVRQLKEYIHELKATREYRKVRGLVICDKKTPELQTDAKKAGFEVQEFSLSINFKD